MNRRTDHDETIHIRIVGCNGSGNFWGIGDEESKISIKFSNPQIITCIIFENLFGPYFLPHQSYSYGYTPSSGENLTSKI